jgi:sec-independent protein translocase protein TatC
METNLQRHNNELVVRIIWYLVSFLSIFLISYYNQNELSCLWTSGLEDSIWEFNKTIPKLQYLHVTDGFKTWVNMHFYWSFLWSFPILLYQFGQFLKPGLKKEEWFNVILLGLFGTFIVSVLSGFLFTNYLWKHILEVLFNFGNNQVDFIPNMGNFLSFYRRTTIAFAIASCLPWVSFLLVKWDIFSYEQTVLLRRWWILVIFLIATIMSPPDVFSQIVIALPLWLFLEATWFILAMMESKKNYNKKE